MGRLMGMATRILVWAFFGAVVAFVAVLVYEMAFTGGTLTFTSPHAWQAAGIGAAVGGVIGFFKRA